MIFEKGILVRAGILSNVIGRFIIEHKQYGFSGLREIVYGDEGNTKQTACMKTCI